MQRFRFERERGGGNVRTGSERNVFFRATSVAAATALVGTSLFFAPRNILFAADGSCLWGAANEKTTYTSPYFSYMAPEIPVLTRPDESTAANGGANGGANGASETNGDASQRADAAASDFETKLRETGTTIGSDGKMYSYSYVRGVQPFRETTSTWVYETPPGGLFPIWVEKKTEKIVWKPVLIKTLRPLNAPTSPAPCVPVAAPLSPR